MWYSSLGFSFRFFLGCVCVCTDRVLEEVGTGTFGKVLECYDEKTNKAVAIKFVRAVEKYREHAEIEIDILIHIRESDKNNVSRCVLMEDWFDYRGHRCLVSCLLSVLITLSLKLSALAFSSS